jgi:hypothetical protein
VVVKIDSSTVRETRWYEYVLRFLFGGLITGGAGIIAERFGPIIGGLFLAFPAIFPASATLIEKHEIEKKEANGLSGRQRGREAAALEAIGSALGSLGLILLRRCFGSFCRTTDPHLFCSAPLAPGALLQQAFGTSAGSFKNVLEPGMSIFSETGDSSKNGPFSSVARTR